MKKLSNFANFLNKYEITLSRKRCGGHYATFRTWQNGNTVNPTVNLFNSFLDIYKSEIGFRSQELYQCFDDYEYCDKGAKPYIYSFSTGLNMYCSLMCNKVIRELSHSNKILVLDERHYDAIMDAYATPEMKSEIIDFAFNPIEYSQDDLRNCIQKTTNSNLDYVFLDRFRDARLLVDFDHSVNHLRDDLLSLSEYELILINHWPEHNGNSHLFYGKIADCLFYAERESDTRGDMINHTLENCNNHQQRINVPIDDLQSNIKWYDLAVASIERIEASEGIVNLKLHEDGIDYTLLLSDALIKSLGLFFEGFKKTNRLRY
jgi:hypothetical protein